ncbi:MAG: hypothetical protein AB1630_12260, partial [bacterium]
MRKKICVLIGVILGLVNPCFSITRNQVVQNALDWEYTDNWTPQIDTVTFGTYTFQSNFRTSANNGNPPYNREAYVFGGGDSEARFIQRINNGVCPGGRNDFNATHSTKWLYKHGYRNEVPQRLAGIDCSAFASRCLEIARTNTTGLANISLRLSSRNDLKPGDMLNYVGNHVILVMTRPQSGNLDTAEATPPNVIIRRNRVMSGIGSNYLPYSPFPQFSNWFPPESPATNTNRPTIRVTIRSGRNIIAGSVTMRIDGAIATPTLSSFNAQTINASYTPTSDLADGTHTVYIYATNELNLEDEATHTFTIDTTPPKIKKAEIFPQEKVEGTMTTMGACGYSKDYDTGNIVSRPLVRECLHLVKIT